MAGEAEPDDRASLDELVRQVMTAESYHEPLIRLAWRYLAAGMSAGQVIETLQGLLRAAPEPHDERWQARFDDVERTVASAVEKQGGKLSWQIIASWMIDKYQPSFVTTDGRVFSDARGRPLKLTEIDEDDDIIGRLAKAIDAPRLKADDCVNWNRLPAQLKTWRGVAWGSLKAGLPDEDAVELASEVAAEDFERQIASLLATIVQLDWGGLRRHSLGAWARYHAFLQPGKWCRVGSFDLWGRVVGGGKLQIAIHPVLASQAKVCPEIAALTQKKLTQRCRTYKIALPEDNRITSDETRIRATILTEAFVDSLALPDAGNDALASALHTRANPPRFGLARGLWRAGRDAY